MATIVFCFPPIISTINSSLRLARVLQAEGHHIRYVGIPDCATTVCPNGFDLFPVYGEWFPKGWFDGCYLKAQSPLDSEHMTKREISGQFKAFLNYLLSGGDSELAVLLHQIKPDIVVISTSGIDSVVWALLIHKFNYPSAYIFDILGGVVNHTAPPVHTDLIADGGLISSIKIVLAWSLFYFKKTQTNRFLKTHGFDVLAREHVIRLAKYCRYPSHDIAFFNDLSAPLLKLPELVFFPKVFDFPKVNKAGRHYVEASIDVDRQQPDFPWQTLVDARPLVYVALGTLPLLAKADYENFFRTVIAASLKWPDWHWVLSIGNNLCVTDFTDVPAHVIIVNRAPQLELLKRATLMITHGGPNSVKECLFFGVPMLLFPLWFDQAGNVARVIFHGLGLQGDFTALTSRSLQELVSEITSNPGYRERIRAMQSHFVALEKAQPSLQLLEQFINHSPILTPIC